MRQHYQSHLRSSLLYQSRTGTCSGQEKPPSVLSFCLLPFFFLLQHWVLGQEELPSMTVGKPTTWRTATDASCCYHTDFLLSITCVADAERKMKGVVVVSEWGEAEGGICLEVQSETRKNAHNFLIRTRFQKKPSASWGVNSILLYHRTLTVFIKRWLKYSTISRGHNL